MRSNYFAVRNCAAFEQVCKDDDVTLIKNTCSPVKRKRGEELVGFPRSGDTGVPRGPYHPEKDS